MPATPSTSSPHPSAPFRRPLAFRLWAALFFSATLAAPVLLLLHRPVAAVIVFFLPAPWYAWQVLRPASRGLGPAINRFATPRSEVWLTIDDGPDPATTAAILDLLDAHRARATFFLIGEKVDRHPALVREILRRGHTVGNHTHTHPASTFWCASARPNAAEVDACADALRRAGAGETRLFRPPVGLKNFALHPQLARRGLDLVLWSARGFDGTCRHNPTILRRLLRHLAPGTILLAHESGPAADAPRRVALLRSLLEELTRRHYTCVIPPAGNFAAAPSSAAR